MKSLFRALLGIVLLVAAWQLLAILLNRSIIPTPATTFRQMGELISSGEIIVAAGQTAWKAFLALLLAMLIGISLGLCLGLSGTLYDMFRPLLMIIQAVPVIAWLSLVIFAWGIGWRGPVFLTFLSLLPISIFTTISGVHNLDKDLLEMAGLYRVPRRKVFSKIYLGSLLPFAIAILDVSIGQAWKTSLVVEYLCGGSGLGVKILMARMNIDFSGVWALTLIAVILGLATERLIKEGLKGIFRSWVTI
ncbi:MAG: ABC transporter permease subunit [Anaerolineae bacterium]|nr:ABC transporter permease subunit [Anaerolineae bacterium]